jgi:cell division transport system permease protein
MKQLFRFSLIRGSLLHHIQSATVSLQKLLQAPFATLMTVIVIAIALALPTGLFVLLEKFTTISKGWSHSQQISLFLKSDITQAEAEKLIDSIKLETNISEIEYISPQQGLLQFKQESGFGDALNYLPFNPLPPVIVIYPSPEFHNLSAMQQLTQSFQQYPQIESVQLDQQWLERLYAILHFGQRTVLSLAVFFGLGVVFIIGNTIRLATQNRRHEIEVIYLIGGTQRFIRRPFLYAGVYYGIFGAMCAWLIVNFSLYWLSTPLGQLLESYGSHYPLQVLSLSQSILLFTCSVLFGLIGSWVAVNRELSRLALE